MPTAVLPEMVDLSTVTKGEAAVNAAAQAVPGRRWTPLSSITASMAVLPEMVELTTVTLPPDVRVTVP